MAETVFGIIGAAVGVSGFVFGLITFLRNKKSDDKTDGEKDGVVLTELGYIKKGIDGIESRLEKQVEKHNDIVERTYKLEGRMDEAEHDIRDIKKKLN